MSRHTVGDMFSFLNSLKSPASPSVTVPSEWTIRRAYALALVEACGDDVERARLLAQKHLARLEAEL